jgi:plastocyanin
MLTRRQLIQTGGVILAGSAWTARAASERVIEIRMRGNADGSRVWFDPIGVLMEPGETVRWINVDRGNSHTTTAYHPRNFDHALRVPKKAKPWDSDYLLPDESFSITLAEPGVYDYFCIPHEMAGMVGRIVVGRPGDSDPYGTRGKEGSSPPAAALDAFPGVEEIMRRGRVFLSAE